MPRLKALVILRAPLPPAATGRPFPRRVCISLALRRVVGAVIGNEPGVLTTDSTSVLDSDGCNAAFLVVTTSSAFEDADRAETCMLGSRDLGGCDVTRSVVVRVERGTCFSLTKGP